MSSSSSSLSDSSVIEKVQVNRKDPIDVNQNNNGDDAVKQAHTVQAYETRTEDIDDSMYAGVAESLERNSVFMDAISQRGLGDIKSIIGEKFVFESWIRAGIAPHMLIKYLTHVLTPKKGSRIEDLEPIRNPKPWVRKAVLNIHSRNRKKIQGSRDFAVHNHLHNNNVDKSCTMDHFDVAEDETDKNHEQWVDAYTCGRREAQRVAMICDFENLNNIRIRSHGFYACFQRHVSKCAEPIKTDNAIFYEGVRFAMNLISSNKLGDAWLEAAFCNGIIDYCFHLAEVAGSI